jgi:glycosyltransferase involved in cell wall biosynthesis
LDPRPTVLPSVLFLNWRDTGHPDGGGSEVYLETVADGLARLGYPTTIFTAAYPGAARHEMRPSGVRIVRRGGRLSVYPWAALEFWRGRLGRARVVVEAQNGIPFLSRLWARRSAGIVLVHHVHREQWRVVLGPAQARIGWWLESRVAPWVNRGSQYVAVSHVTRRELTELGVRESDIQVLHNGTSPRPPIPVSRAERPTLLALGRLVPHKRVEIAVDAVADLVPEFPDLQLIVAGRGWWSAELARYVMGRGLEDHVELVGFVSPEQRHELYARCWVSLVPSLKEGWGLTVVEAGVHATPTVAFRSAGGVAESIVDGQTGLLSDDQRSFVAHVRNLLRDHATRERLGSNAERYARQFTWQQTIADFAALIDKLADSSDAAGRLDQREP